MILLQGCAIGLLFGLPVGAIGAMSVQRTLRYGLWAGIWTGLASSIADCIYAALGAFGWQGISALLLAHQSMIHCVGGCLIVMMGLWIFFQKSVQQEVQRDALNQIRLFLSAFMIAITNPAAILTFLFAFSWMGIESLNPSQACFLVIGVFFGTFLWWLFISLLSDRARRHHQDLNIVKMNRYFGSGLSIFGMIVLVGTIL